MFVISLALDSKVLDPESVVAFRTRAYGEIVSHYSVLVSSPSDMTVKLSNRATIYGVSGMGKAVRLYKMYQKAVSLIRAGKCDVITSQDMYYLGALGLFLAWRYKLGLEVQVLGIEKLSWFRKKLAIFVMRRASVVRALSTRLEHRLIHEFGIPKSSIVVVPIYVDVKKLGLDVRTLHGRDAEVFRKESDAFAQTYGKNFNFLAVCRLVPIKRIEMQLQAIHELSKTHPQVRLHIVGAGPLLAELKARVAELQISEHVIFHGYQSGAALGLFYISADCFLLTSDYEGWGMVIIEAMSAGLPVIMTDVGCAGELVVDGVSGLVIPPRDQEALTVAMNRLMTDSALRNQLSVGATAALAQLPNFENILEQYKKNWEVALAHRL